MTMPSLSSETVVADESVMALSTKEEEEEEVEETQDLDVSAVTAAETSMILVDGHHGDEPPTTIPSNEDGNVDDDDDQEEETPDEPPLLYYHRLPKPTTTTTITSAIGGQVILNAQSVVEDNNSNSTNNSNMTNSNSSGSATSTSSHNNSRSGVTHHPTNSGPWQRGATGGAGGAGSSTSTNTSSSIPYQHFRGKPIGLYLTGMSNGTVVLRETLSGNIVHEFHTTTTSTTSTTPKVSIVDVSMDATGTILAAVDQAGHCYVWTVGYRITRQTPTTTTMTSRPATTAAATMTSSLTSFFWRTADPFKASASAATTTSSPPNSSSNNNNNVTGPPESSATSSSPNNNSRTNNTTTATNTTCVSSDDNSTNNNNNNNNNPIMMIPKLSVAEVKTTTIYYAPRDYGRPTVLTLDPSYRRTNKLIMAFDTGVILLTAPNWMFRSEHIRLPYLGAPVTHPDWRGIEQCAWRGSLLAFADCSGVKLYDTTTLTPVAHVDRPVGAAQTTIAVTPRLVFETNASLLVAWADCLMNLIITDHAAAASVSATGVNSNSSVGGGSASSTTTTTAATTTTTSPTNAGESSLTTSTQRRRTVSCRMAWALDCLAAGVAPMDEHHVAILGHPEDAASSPELLEVEIIDRRNGTVVWSDLLNLSTTIAKPTSSSILSSMALSSTATRQQQQQQQQQQQLEMSNKKYLTLLSTYVVPKMDEGLELVEYQRKLGDAFLEWDLQRVHYDVAVPKVDDDQQQQQQQQHSPVENVDDDDTSSVDSDDYGFLVRNHNRHGTTHTAIFAKELLPLVMPPFVLIMTAVDGVLGRLRTVDDAISYALEQDRVATALHLSMVYAPHLVLHDINDIIDTYLHALLAPDRLSLRRMKLAADALPTLLGGHLNLWQRWVTELEKIPGALFVVRTIIPVRDPQLPSQLYERFLSQMLEEVETMRRKKNADKILVEAEGHFLTTLLGWGTTRSLQEHISLYQSQSKTEPVFEHMARLMEGNLRYRAEQSAAGYLSLFGTTSTPAHQYRSAADENGDSLAGLPESTEDALYDIDAVIDFISERIALNAASTPHHDKTLNSRIALDAVARLYMMNGSFEEALRFFLFLGTLHATDSLDDIESQAIAFVNDAPGGERKSGESRPYSFLLQLIAKHHLHECLLQHNFLPDVVGTSPICSLTRLVGLDLMGDFLMEYCTPPQQLDKDVVVNVVPYLLPNRSAADTSSDRLGTLPLDRVADQLAGSSKLLHWYLHLVFIRKPELYVKFPNTANPPQVITDLYKKQLELYIKLAGDNRDSAKALAGVEAYRVMEKSTPLLAFLRVVVKLGSVSPVEVGKLLEIERRGGAGVSSTFAIELAYIMENFGSKNDTDAQLILELYLKGAQSLMLAVSYAQRTKKHHIVLWETLIAHCLASRTADGGVDGRLFGSLLEAAALCGGDLAKLVAKIPPGMQVEGLRPRLVAAVADYRLKVKLHETSSDVATKEKILLVHEEALRARRGVRISLVADNQEKEQTNNKSPAKETKRSTITKMDPSKLRTKHRPNRYHHKVTIPIR